MKTVHVYLLVIALVLVLVVGGGAVAVRALSKAEQGRRDMLLPQVRAALDQLRARLASVGIETFVGSTGRTEEEQRAHIEAGRSDVKFSWHQLGRAVHVAPVIAGKTIINDPELTRHIDVLRRIHREAAGFGFRGIAFNADGSKKFLKSGAWDALHLEYPEDMTLAQAAAKERRVA